MYTIFWIQIKLVGLQCHKTSSLAPFEPGNPARLAASAQEAVSLSKGQPPVTRQEIMVGGGFRVLNGYHP